MSEKIFGKFIDNYRVKGFCKKATDPVTTTAAASAALGTGSLIGWSILTLLAGGLLGGLTGVWKRQAAWSEIERAQYEEAWRHLAPYLLSGGIGAALGGAIGSKKQRTLPGMLLGTGIGLLVPVISSKFSQ